MAGIVTPLWHRTELLVLGDPVSYRRASPATSEWEAGIFQHFLDEPDDPTTASTRVVSISPQGTTRITPSSVTVSGLIQQACHLDDAVLAPVKEDEWHLATVKGYDEAVPGMLLVRRPGLNQPNNLVNPADLRPLDRRLKYGTNVWYFDGVEYAWKQGRIMDLRLRAGELHPQVRVSGSEPTPPDDIPFHDTYDRVAQLGTLLLDNDPPCERTQEDDLLRLGNPTLLGLCACLRDRMQSAKNVTDARKMASTTPSDNELMTRRQYTRLGSALISVNPENSMPYNDGNYLQREYVSGGRSSNIDTFLTGKPVHLVEVMLRAWSRLQNPDRTQRKPQSIIISGSSGSGKTVNARTLLDFLRDLCLDALNRKRVSGASHEREELTKLTKRMKAALRVLDMFGNARTPLNHDSSRYGKYVRAFLIDTKLIGYRLDDYLLERNRAYQHLENHDCLYHAFYYYRYHDTLNEQEKQLYEECLPKHGVYDIKEAEAKLGLHTLNEAFETLGIQLDPLVSSIPRFLLFLLLHRKMDFDELKPKKKEEASIYVLKEKGRDEWFAYMSKYVYNETRAPKEHLSGSNVNTNLYAPRTKRQELVNNRNAFVKQMYLGLWQALVKRVNEAIKGKLPPEIKKWPKTYVGILDIFGFENFAENGPLSNGLGQLCINYTNEVIAAVYNGDTFENEYAKYATTVDGCPSVQVLRERPSTCVPVLRRLFGLVTTYSNDRTDDKPSDFTDRVRTQLEPNESCAFGLGSLKDLSSGKAIKGQDAESHVLQVRHYAGLVTYRLQGLAAEDNDDVPPAYYNQTVDKTNNNKLLTPVEQQIADFTYDRYMEMDPGFWVKDQEKVTQQNVYIKAWNETHFVRYRSAVVESLEIQVVKGDGVDERGKQFKDHNQLIDDAKCVWLSVSNTTEGLRHVPSDRDGWVCYGLSRGRIVHRIKWNLKPGVTTDNSAIIVLEDEMELPFHWQAHDTRSTDGVLVPARPRPHRCVSYSFVRAMERMREDLRPTERQFVRCIKSNNERPKPLPNYVDVALVLPQLVAAGILQTVTLQQTIYPNRWTCAEFRREYQCLFPVLVGSHHDDNAWCEHQLRYLTAFELAVDLPRAGRVLWVPRPARRSAQRSRHNSDGCPPWTGPTSTGLRQFLEDGKSCKHRSRTLYVIGGGSVFLMARGHELLAGCSPPAGPGGHPRPALLKEELMAEARRTLQSRAHGILGRQALRLFSQFDAPRPDDLGWTRPQLEVYKGLAKVFPHVEHATLETAAKTAPTIADAEKQVVTNAKDAVRTHPALGMNALFESYGLPDDSRRQLQRMGLRTSQALAQAVSDAKNNFENFFAGLSLPAEQKGPMQGIFDALNESPNLWDSLASSDCGAIVPLPMR